MIGSAICDSLRRSGVGVSQWQPAAIGGSTYECIYEHSRLRREEPTSLFLLVRGDQSGAITNIRLKTVNPKPNGSEDLDPETTAALSLLADLAGLIDLQNAIETISNLNEYEAQGFAAKLAFVREPTSRASFNLILTPNVEHTK